MYRLSFRRPRALRAFFLLFCPAAFAATLFCGAHAKAATLNGMTYDLALLGHVKNAVGTVLSAEGYTASPVFNASSTNLVNSTVPAPIPPLVAGNALRVDESEAGNTAIFWIRGPLSNPNHTFANMLDPNFDVELDLTLRFDELGPNQKVAIVDVDAENGTNGFYDPVSYSTSGLGTTESPLLLSIRLDPEEIQGTFSTSHVKVHVDFMEMVIPEPASWLLLSAAMLTMIGYGKRRRIG